MRHDGLSMTGKEHVTKPTMAFSCTLVSFKLDIHRILPVIVC